MKARIVNDSEGRFYGIRYNCPGCALFDPEMGRRIAGAHVLPVSWLPPGATPSPHHTPGQHPEWGFNGNFEKPTFSPSILTRFGVEGQPEFVCHSFVRDGKAQFLGDCTHALANQTVDLPELDDET